MKDGIIAPVERMRVYDQIISQFQELVASNELEAGERLPPERELAEMFGVSRGVLREALRTLEFCGLVESKPRGGTFVKQASIAGMIMPFAPFFAEDDEFLHDTLELRLILEPPLARLCAERASDQHLERLKHYLGKHENHIEKREPAIEADTMFHVTIAEGTGNMMIAQFVYAIGFMLRAWRAAWLQGRPAVSIDHHRAIYEGIAAGDGEVAEEAMRKHLQNLYDNMTRLLDVKGRNDRG